MIPSFPIFTIPFSTHHTPFCPHTHVQHAHTDTWTHTHTHKICIHTRISHEQIDGYVLWDHLFILDTSLRSQKGLTFIVERSQKYVYLCVCARVCT